MEKVREDDIKPAGIARQNRRFAHLTFSARCATIWELSESVACGRCLWRCGAWRWTIPRFGRSRRATGRSGKPPTRIPSGFSSFWRSCATDGGGPAACSAGAFFPLNLQHVHKNRDICSQDRSIITIVPGRNQDIDALICFVYPLFLSLSFLSLSRPPVRRQKRTGGRFFRRAGGTVTGCHSRRAAVYNLFTFCLCSV